MSDLEKWESGETLNFAVDKFADPYQRSQYRNSHSSGSTYAIKSLVYGDLFGHITGGELEAYGFKVAPLPLSDGPVRIPRHCFLERPNIEECDTDIIDVSGWRYERVRITAKSAVSKIEQETIPTKGNKSGRRSTYPLTRKVLRQLYGPNPEYILESAETLIDPFNKMYESLDLLEGVKRTGLSARTLRDHLKRFQKELEENSKNKNPPFVSMD